MPSFDSNDVDPSIQDNPIRTFFDNFQRETPMVTRITMLSQGIAFGFSIFFDLRLGLGNVPVFTLYKFEIYRLFTSLFVCSGFFSLVLAYFSFLPTGKRLEYSMGSTEFGCFILTIGMMTSVMYICFAFLLDGLQGGQYWAVNPSYGLWNILFGVIAMECTKAPQNSFRKFFVWTIPTIYYPVALLFFFSFLGEFSLAHLISIGLGYGFGHGYLEMFRVSPSRCKVWEERYLQSMANSDQNFIVSSTALGSGAWSEDFTTQHAEGQSVLNSLLSRLTSQQQPSNTSGVAMGSDDVAVSATSALPTSGGHQLGGVSRLQNKDPRQARLQALERRMAANVDPKK